MFLRAILQGVPTKPWPLLTFQLGFAFWSHFARQRIDVEQGGPEFRACHIYLFLSYALSSTPTSTIYYFICSTFPSCSAAVASRSGGTWLLVPSLFSRTLSLPSGSSVSLRMAYFAIALFVRDPSVCNDLLSCLMHASLSPCHFTFYANSNPFSLARSSPRVSTTWNIHVRSSDTCFLRRVSLWRIVFSLPESGCVFV